MNSIIDPQFLVEVFVHLLKYVPVTLELAVISMALSCLLGLVTLAVRMNRIPVLGRIAEAYVLIGRAMTTMIILYLVFYALPIGLTLFAGTMGKKADVSLLPAMLFAIIGLTLHTGAYLTEAFRAAVEAVDKGQMEAALSVGMSWRQAFLRIILPQAAVFAMPLMANQFLNLIKGTAIAFMITVMEMFGAANVLSANNNRYLEVYIVVTLMYWGMSVFFEKVFLVVETKLAFFKKG